MIHARLARKAPALMLSVALASAAASPSVAAPGATDVPAESDGIREADRIVKAVEDRLARSGSLSANFTQTFRSAATMQQLIERGRLFVKRPGRMRWDYRQPDKKVVLVRADGSTLAYMPADYTAIKSRLPDGAPQLRLLLGDGRLLESFTAVQVELKQPIFPGSKQVKLVPKKPTEGVEVLYVEIDPRTFGVQRVLLIDPLGNESDLVLEKVSEEARLGDDVFDIQLPPGVSIRDATMSGGS